MKRASEAVHGAPDVYSQMSSHGELLLAGVVGSTAYGLATPMSDTDRLGIFAAPTLDICGLRPPKESHALTGSSDATFHEAAKFLRLALSCNPTVTELLWLDEYEVCGRLGSRLIAIRSSFLSASKVRDSYLGYAKSQLMKLQKRADGTFSSKTSNRSSKHARHMARLVNQGLELYSTGHLTLRVPDPQWYHDFSAETPEVWEQWFADAVHRFENASTVLPDTPDFKAAEDWLTRVRIANLPDSITRRMRVWLDEE